MLESFKDLKYKVKHHIIQVNMCEERYTKGEKIKSSVKTRKTEYLLF